MNNIFARIEMPNTLPDSRVRIFPFLRNNQSTFNLFLIPEGRGSDGKKIFSYVDNEQIKTKNWFGAKNLSIQDVMKIFEEYWQVKN